MGRRASLWARGAMVVALVGGVSACQQDGGKAASTLPPSIARTGVTHAGEGGRRPDLSRPVASPAPGLDRVNTRMVVEVRPLGAVPFDSMTLPLVAAASGGEGGGEPDLWIATQHGATPSWPVLLADGSAESLRVPGNLRISAYRVDRRGADVGGAMRLVDWEGPLPKGLVLGRSADAAGFLVESPRAGGGRWIGKVAWETGNVEWLVGGEEFPGVAAFASLGPVGELAYAHRAVPGGPFELVVRGVRGVERRLAAPTGESLVFPTFSADRSRVYVFSIPGPGGRLPRLLAVELGSGASAELRVGASVELNVEASVGAAWHSTACLTTPWGVEVSGPLGRGLAFESLESGAMAWMDGASGGVRGLTRGTVGAALVVMGAGPERRAIGLVLGAAGEAVYQPLLAAETEGGVADFGREMAVIRGAFVPRASWTRAQGDCGIVLLSPPVAGVGNEVGVIEVVPRAGE